MDNISKQYPFRRSFYYAVEKALQDSCVSFILGARKCGKTICMKQIASQFSDTVYVDMKKDFESAMDKILFVKKIVSDIENDKAIIYLIDEATYLDFPDRTIEEIADAFSEVKNHHTRVVFAGSQSKALDSWGHRAFAGNASFVQADFLSYPEWLAYQGVAEVSAQTYSDFIKGTREFYPEFTSIKEYLKGCLEETVISNHKAAEMIFGNDCSEITVDMLLDVLYSSLVTLHNHVNYPSFVRREYFQETFRHYFPESYSQIGNENFLKEIGIIMRKRYTNFKNMNPCQLKQCLQFLTNCGLITITYVTDDFSVNPYICQNILSDFKDTVSKTEIMERINICIKYPMFYVDMIKSLLKEQMPSILPKPLLGSIVECHVRGLLPETGCFEYHDAQEKEIDYVSNSQFTAIEISVSNKKTSATNLLPEGYRKVLLTKDKSGFQGDIECVPYYQFIYENSVGRELCEPQAEQKHCDCIITPRMFDE